MPSKIKIEFCTSCGSQDIKVTGNTYYCPDCDISYKVTTQGTKVVDANPLGKEKARVDQLEQDVAELKGQKVTGPDQTGPQAAADGEADVIDLQEGDKEDEDESEQDGFISIEP